MLAAHSEAAMIMSKRIKTIANAREAHYQSLIKVWLQEKLRGSWTLNRDILD